VRSSGKRTFFEEGSQDLCREADERGVGGGGGFTGGFFWEKKGEGGRVKT